MANKNPVNQFAKDSQPKKRRGKSERTKILDAMKRNSRDEDEFYDLLITRAFNPEDNFAFKELLSRVYPVPKSTMPLIQFEFDESATPSVKASQIMKASADGIIPPDVANTFIASLASMLKITEITELEERLKALEDNNNG